MACGQVYLIDDDADVRSGLSTLLDLLGYEVTTFADPAAFLKHRLAPGPAVILLDVRLPAISGVALRDRLVAGGLTHPIVFMSGECAAQEIVDAMKGGAVDFLLKPFSRGDLERALASAMDQARRHDAHERTRARFAEGLVQLSPREREVLALMLRGYQNRQISDRLSIRADTAKKYRSSICEKFGVQDTVDLIELAEATGFRAVAEPDRASAPRAD